MRNPNSGVPDLDRCSSPAGSRYHVRHEARFDGRSLTLVESGRIDLQDSIEAYAPYTDINFMLSRLKVGDSSVLASRPPMYGDFSGMPNNPVDAINMVHGAESSFLNLSLEDRQKYNNDFRVWLADLIGRGSVRSDGADPDHDPAVPAVPADQVVKE